MERAIYLIYTAAPMSLAPGQSLSQYRLVSPLGQGGMGVVWRATDTTLGRDVAIKIVPDLFASDIERIARFEREAKVLATLNHPSIASIYGLHSADGTRFLVMELVDGEDLARRLARGPIPVAEALPMALQIAQALEHAHERGVVHRDLKPGNVALSSDGKVKVLDFGLAKALEGDAGGSPTSSPSMLSQSPTITGHLTGANVLLGTAAYMAPEQARGHAADKRADIWAFGAVVMEMLTGRRLFEGETITDTLASVLRSDLDWDTLPADTPPRLRALLQRCLERNPKQRLRDIGEARIALEETIAGKPDAIPAAAAAPARRGLSPLVTAIAGLVLGALAVLAIARPLGSRKTPAPLRKFHLALPAVEGAAPRFPAISPDGRMVAYVAAGSIWVQSLVDLQPREIKTPHAAFSLFWSPDGKQLGYLMGTQIFRCSPDGSEIQTICDARGEFTGGSGASWGEDGTVVFSRGDTAGVLQVPAMGGDPKTLIRPSSSYSDAHEPAWLPGNRGIVFVEHRGIGGMNNIVVWAKGKTRTLLELPGQTLGHVSYDPGGYLLFSRTPTTPGIWALPFSLAKLQATGQPFLVAAGASLPSVSQEGTLALLRGGFQTGQQLAWWSREGKEIGIVGPVESGTSGFAALSADGRRIAWPTSGGAALDIWILDAARGTRTRLTFDPGREEYPAWSPGGDRIAYHVLGAGIPTIEGFRILVRPADGTGTIDTVVAGVAPQFTPDGTHLVYVGPQQGGAQWALMEVPLQGDRTPRRLVPGNPRVIDGRVSPAGTLLAYMSDESGEWEVYLTRYPSCQGRWQVSTAGGQWPRWSTRGDVLYFAQGDNIMKVAVRGGESPELGTPERLFTRPALGVGTFGFVYPFAVTADGARFLIHRSAAGQGPPPGVLVAQSWASEFAKRK